jgi:hypothetical protein
VVISEYETLVADDLASTETAEVYDGVFEATLVDAVNVFGSDLHPHALHFLFIEVFEQEGKPHSAAGR